MATITQKKLVDRVAQSTSAKPSTVKAVAQSFLDEMTSELAKGNRLEFRDFSMFEIRAEAAREAHNPKTPEPIDVPAKRVVRFKMGRIMRQGLNGKAKKP
jgi:integration host factor subunit beta